MAYKPIFAWANRNIDIVLKSLISSKYLVTEDIEVEITKDKVLDLVGIKSITDFDNIAKNQDNALNFDWYVNNVLEKLATAPIANKYKEIVQNPKEIYNFIEQFEDVETLAEDENMSVDEYLQSESTEQFIQAYLGLTESNGYFSIDLEHLYNYDSIYQAIRDILVDVQNEYIQYICDTILEYAESLGMETSFQESHSIVSTISKYMTFSVDDFEEAQLEIRYSDHDNGQISADLNLWYQDGMQYNIDKAKQKLLEFKKSAQ